MLGWIWLTIFILSVLLVLYPYTIYPLILSLIPGKHYQTDSSARPDPAKNSVALLFCAYNEEKALPDKIENIRKLKQVWPDLEVLAYSDASADTTNSILQEASGILHAEIGNKRLGKALGMKKLVSMTQAEIIVFTDANVLLDPESLPRLIQYFSDPEIDCVSGKLLYEGIDSATAKVGGLYWKLEEKIKYLESKTGSTMGADGAVFARRREGYPEVPRNLVDDMAVSMATIFDGKRCVSAPNVIAFENAISSSAEEFKRKKRIACGSYSTYLYQRDQIKNMSALNKFKFVSHKLLRWWGALFIIIAAVSFIFFSISIGYGWYAMLTVLGGAGSFILFARKGIPGFNALYEIVSAIFATGLGVVEALNGKEYQTWETADTR